MNLTSIEISKKKNHKPKKEVGIFIPDPRLEKELKKGMNIKIEDCIDESEVKW